MVKFFYELYPFELQMPVAFLLKRLWKKKKKDHREICDCDLKCGHCIAKLDWTIERLRQMWKVSYVDFDQSISKILEQDPSFINFDQLDNIYTCDFEKSFLIRN